MKDGTDTRDSFEDIGRAIMQIGWLGQRQFMQLLGDERFDLTVPQFHTLLHLSHCPNDCKMSDLARATQQSAASLTGVVDRLIEKQMVARSRPNGDRRQVMVSITQRGENLLKDIKQARSNEMRAALAQFDADDMRELRRLLNQTLDGMRRVAQDRERNNSF